MVDGSVCSTTNFKKQMMQVQSMSRIQLLRHPTLTTRDEEVQCH